MTPTPPDWNGPISRGRAVNRIMVDLIAPRSNRNEISIVGLSTTEYMVERFVNDDLHTIIDDNDDRHGWKGGGRTTKYIIYLILIGNYIFQLLLIGLLLYIIAAAAAVVFVAIGVCDTNKKLK